MKKLLWGNEIGKAVGRCSKTIANLADSGVIECERDARGRRLYKPEVIGVLLKHFGLRRSDGPASEERIIQQTSSL